MIFHFGICLSRRDELRGCAAQLEAAGHAVLSDWLIGDDEEPNLAQSVDDIGNADITIFIPDAGNSDVRAFEMGAAVAYGRLAVRIGTSRTPFDSIVTESYASWAEFLDMVRSHGPEEPTPGVQAIRLSREVQSRYEEEFWMLYGEKLVTMAPFLEKYLPGVMDKTSALSDVHAEFYTLARDSWETTGRPKDFAVNAVTEQARDFAVHTAVMSWFMDLLHLAALDHAVAELNNRQQLANAKMAAAVATAAVQVHDAVIPMLPVTQDEPSDPSLPG